MAGTKSRIEWTERTWNIVVGCTKTSPGCLNCYAESMAARLQAMGAAGYADGFELRLRPERLTQPLERSKPTVYFVCSMSDLFHEDVPFEFIDSAFEVMRRCPQHTFQVLTKRAERMADYFSTRRVPDNVWVGVTVENRKHGLPRLHVLRSIDAATRFISAEPLLESLGEINLAGIALVIVGGESGRRARRMLRLWAEEVCDQAVEQGAHPFFKQWGAWGEDGIRRSKKANGRLLRGRQWDEIPQRRTIMLAVSEK